MKQIVLVGSNSFIATGIQHKLAHQYNFVGANRNPTGNQIKIEMTHPMPIDINTVKGTYDGLVFCQGINPCKNLEESSAEHFNSMLQINITSSAFLFKAMLPFLNPQASIVFFTSIAAKKGSYDPAYAAAKAGLAGLQQSLANAYPAFRFNTISLGLVANSPVHLGMSQPFIDKHTNSMFNNKLIEIDNVAQVVDMLLSNTNINRTEIVLDGGFKL
jgi:NAD(P)-dependent dehydrogenase (short-subunit alcohol dehydrogenase family)